MVEPRISDHEELRELFVDADGVNLHCLEWDPSQLDNQPSSLQEHEDRMPYSDEIPLVMLHGLAATADTWRLVARVRLCRAGSRTINAAAFRTPQQ